MINVHAVTVAPSLITTVNQTHSGSGDNVTGHEIFVTGRGQHDMVQGGVVNPRSLNRP
jgi:hypothetical protein